VPGQNQRFQNGVLLDSMRAPVEFMRLQFAGATATMSDYSIARGRGAAPGD
jgi:hypothetical protein